MLETSIDIRPLQYTTLYFHISDTSNVHHVWVFKANQKNPNLAVLTDLSQNTLQHKYQ